MAEAVATTPAPPLADFPLEEYAARTTRFAGLLREAGLDGVVVLSEVNHRYLSGHWSKRWDYSLNATVVNADGDAVLVVSGLELGQATASSWVRDVRTFDYGSSRRSQGFRDVIVQASDDPAFKTGVTTIFNNDHDNTSKLGAGKDKEYIDVAEGRLFVSDHGNGDIVAFDLSSGEELDRITVPEEKGIMGLEIGPDGLLYYAHGKDDITGRIDP